MAEQVNIPPYFRIPRSPFKKQRWTDEKFTKGQAEIDLYNLANHSPGTITKRCTTINLKPGQVGWSIRKLAERWRWSEKKTKRFLNVLQKEGHIALQVSKVSSTITLLNYIKKAPQTTLQTTFKRPPNNKETNKRTNNIYISDQGKRTDLTSERKFTGRNKSSNLTRVSGQKSQNLHGTKVPLEQKFQRWTNSKKIDLDEFIKDYPRLDVALSHAKYVSNCKAKGKQINITDFDLWCQTAENNGWNLKPDSEPGVDDVFSDKILRSCDCPADIWVPKKLAVGNCKKCGSRFRGPG